MRKFSFLVLIFSIILLGSWGFQAHRTIHQLSVYHLPKPLALFYFSEMKQLVQLSVDADQRQKEDSTEKTKHYIDLDIKLYQKKYPQMNWEKAKKTFSEKTLHEYGTLPWEIIKTYNALVVAFNNLDKKAIIQKSADLGHYISDAHVPLHTSENYDGQLTNQAGLHSLWETEAFINAYDSLNMFEKTSNTKIKNIEKETWVIIKNTSKLVPSVFKAELDITKSIDPNQKYKYRTRNGKEERKYSGAFITAYRQKLQSQINSQFLKSVKTTSNFWYNAWVEAGQPDLSKLFENNQSLSNNFNNEIAAWQTNTLLKNQLIRAKNGNK